MKQPRKRARKPAAAPSRSRALEPAPAPRGRGLRFPVVQIHNGERRAITFPNAAAQPRFFQTLRQLMSGKQLQEPYRQHAWWYAANKAQVTALASVRYRIYTEDKSSAGTTTQQRERAAIKWVKSVRRDVDVEQLRLAARIEDPRRRFVEISRLAPALPPEQLCRAVVGVKVVTEGPWVDVFENVNDEMTRSQLWEATWLNLGQFGECFWMLDGRLGPVAENEVPTEIWPCGPQGWEPIPDKSGLRVAGWSWTYTDAKGKERKKPFELHQVVRFHYYSPYGPRGLAPYDPAKRDIETDWKAGDYNEAFFDNGGSPGGYLIYEGPHALSDEQVEELVDKHMERHSHRGKGHRPGFFQGGLKFVEAGVAQKDMEFGAMRDRARDVTLAVAETPRVAVGIIEDFNRANLDGTLRMWWETKLIPKTQYAEDLTFSDLFTDARVGEGKGKVWGAFDLSTVAALREDLNAKLQSAEALFGLGVPLNDINALLGLNLPTYPHGNTPYLAIGYQPIGEDVDEEDEDTEDEEDDDAADDDAEDDDEDDGKKSRSTRAWYRSERGRRWLELKASIFDPAEAIFMRRLQRWLMAMRSAQLKKLKADGVKDAGLEPGPWTARLKKETRPAYERVWKMATDQVAEEIERAQSKAKPKKQQTPAIYMDGLQTKLDKVAANIQKTMKRVLDTAVAEGWTQDETAEALRTAFNHINRGGRLGVVARTSASGTINGARSFAMAAAGVEKHEWLTVRDKHVRDTHRAYEKKGAVPIGSNFAKGKGYTLRYPHDPDAPAGEVINCRCVTVPV